MTELLDPTIFRTVLESLPTGVYMVGREGKIVFWNDGAERITGFQRHEVIGRLCRENILVHCNQQNCVLCGIACPQTGTMREGKSANARVFFCHKAGHRVAVHLHAVPIRDHKGLIIGMAESFDEQIAEPATDNCQINLAAHGCLDAITGVMNQSLLRSYLREHLAFFAEYDLSFGILSIRIDDLERFRIAHGREAGDDILHVVAETMKRALASTGFLGRWNEDEFVVIVPNCTGADLSQAGESIQTSVSSSEIRWWGDLLSVTVSVGKAMVQAGDKVESLLERAEREACVPVLQPPSDAAASSKS
ncbi:MAG TPA: diguanylate cyclase [Terriglobales bacterium]|jgi:diguanylate cyclase (GGDEF)-like protein/PAS domain S-box-containing protein|nr:diguanylate cyclase [Terriglobales bacterium]